MATLYKTDFTKQEVTPKNGTDFDLKELQGFVDGYIELVYLSNNRVAVVNEDGLNIGLEWNRLAACELGRMFVGNVLVCDSDQVR